ncbi:hypothetical protein BH23ACT12_BH23ACT12_06640 [soil metagenome]
MIAMWMSGMGEQTAGYGTALFGIVTFGLGLISRRRQAGVA